MMNIFFYACGAICIVLGLACLVSERFLKVSLRSTNFGTFFNQEIGKSSGTCGGQTHLQPSFSSIAFYLGLNPETSTLLDTIGADYVTVVAVKWVGPYTLCEASRAARVPQGQQACRPAVR